MATVMRVRRLNAYLLWIEFRFDLLPGNERFAGVFNDRFFKVSQVFQVFDALLKTRHGLAQRFDFLKDSGFTHTLAFDLLQHKPGSRLLPVRTARGANRRGAGSDSPYL
jgi:hypothetical protein